MKVSGAVVCLNCDEVYDPKIYDYCPFCGGFTNLVLHRYFPSLNKIEPDERSERAA